ncbi:hypothetical protein [Oceanobacillus massiliensis]|uniref:hypothetical protein n=1 Tax=Oceanobacillus massiliensis TaxID=1465765 RepID=UPI003015F27D
MFIFSVGYFINAEVTALLISILGNRLQPLVEDHRCRVYQTLAVPAGVGFLPFQSTSFIAKEYLH